MAHGSSSAARILIVEDHPPSARLLIEALEQEARDLTCLETRTAKRALEILRECESSARGIDLVLLDLELPDQHGFEVLAEIRDDPNLRHKPVIVISADPAPGTVDRCYALNARTFIPKPADWEGFRTTAATIVEYWFDTAVRPNSSGYSVNDVDPVIEVE